MNFLKKIFGGADNNDEIADLERAPGWVINSIRRGQKSVTNTERGYLLISSEGNFFNGERVKEVEDTYILERLPYLHFYELSQKERELIVEKQGWDDMTGEEMIANMSNTTFGESHENTLGIAYDGSIYLNGRRVVGSEGVEEA